MKSEIYSVLNPISETFYKQAPADNTVLPVIVFYFLNNEPLYQFENSYSDERRIIVNIEVFDKDFVDDKAREVEQAIKANFKGILRNETEIDDGETFGIRFEFEIFKL